MNGNLDTIAQLQIVDADQNFSHHPTLSHLI
jgi:hypothetical protein